MDWPWEECREHFGHLTRALHALTAEIRRHREISGGSLTFAIQTGDTNMSAQFLVGTAVNAALVYTKPDGSVGKPASIPVWTNDNAAVWAPSVAADGMSASGNVLAEGDCNVTVVAEGDPTAGVDTVTLTGTLTGAVEISGGQLTFTAAAPAPAAAAKGGPTAQRRF